MPRFIKDNRFVRGLYFLYKSYFCPGRASFGGIAENVIITPPYSFSNPKNIFIGENVGIGPRCTILATNAKCIIKGNTAIAGDMTIVTGNHALEIGKFITDFNESNKPKGLDKDVVIEKDVWIGSRVTVFERSHYWKRLCFSCWSCC